MVESRTVMEVNGNVDPPIEGEGEKGQGDGVVSECVTIESETTKEENKIEQPEQARFGRYF